MPEISAAQLIAAGIRNQYGMKDDARTASIEGHSDYDFAKSLRGFGPTGITAILVVLLTGNLMVGSTMLVIPAGAILVLVWKRLSQTPWPELGYARPRNWIITIGVGLVFGVSFKLLMKALVMPLFGADPINRPYHFLAGNQNMLPTAIWAMCAAGFGEETVFRGFLFERLGKLLGQSIAATIVIVTATSIAFGLAHFTNLGLTGVEQAIITGVAFGTIFAITRRIWMIMIAHAAFDLTALALIYWNLETRVAHFFFK